MITCSLCLLSGRVGDKAELKENVQMTTHNTEIPTLTELLRGLGLLAQKSTFDLHCIHALRKLCCIRVISSLCALSVVNNSMS